MKELKSLEQLRPTPELLAQEAGRRIVGHVINGMIRHPQGCLNEAKRYGRGEELVKKTEHYAMALELTKS